MTKAWIICSVMALALAAGLALPAMAEEPQNVAGTWTGTLTVRRFKEEFTLALTQEGQVVTGTFSSKVTATGGGRGSKAITREREDIPVTGTLTGDKLSLRIGKQGSLEGTVNGDSMTGTEARGNNPPRHVAATRAK